MPRRTALTAVAAVALVAVGWGIAQPVQTDRAAPPSGGGPYAVTASGDTAVLLDTKTGRTWVLNKSVKGNHVWLPAEVIMGREEAEKYRDTETVLRREETLRKKEEYLRRIQQGE